jgi:hypothetical protein
MNKCCHTLFSSVLLHYLISRWIHPHESSLNSTLLMPSPRIISLHCNLEEPIFPNPLTYPNPMPTWFCSHVLNYSTCKCANWVIQAFSKPCLVQCPLKFYWPFPTKLSNSYLTIHDLLPYPSCHNISIKLNC